MIRVNIDKKDEINMFKKFKRTTRYKNQFNKIYVNEGKEKDIHLLG